MASPHPTGDFFEGTPSLQVRRTKSAVHLATVSDPDDDDNQVRVFDGVEDPIVSLPYAIQLVTCKLLASRRAGVAGEPMDSGNDASTILGRHRFEFLDGRWLDLQFIACHGAAV